MGGNGVNTISTATTTAEIEYVTCGRPTNAGRPCRQRLMMTLGHELQTACPKHITPNEREAQDAASRGFRAGWTSGYETGRESSTRTVARLEAELCELRQRIDARDRIYQINGRQIVEVGKYSYLWRDADHPLSVGDQVMLPENWVSSLRAPGPHPGVVTALGSTYQGQMSTIVSRCA